MPGKQSSVTDSANQGGAIFCVDVGSGSARAAYCAPGKDPVLLDNPNGAPNRRYHANEFSTSLYLSDPADQTRETVYRGENESQNAGLPSWPAKFAIYRLFYKVENFPAKIKGQYPHVFLPDCPEEEEEPLREAIRRGWRQMFGAIRDGLERHLDNTGDPFPHRLVVTMPPHWEDDLDLAEVICRLINDAFPEIPRQGITSWSEPEALLRQISTERWFHKEVFGNSADAVPSAVVCLIDVGGHNTGVINCFLSLDKRSKLVTIVRVGECVSAGGGGERWEWEVAELYNRVYLETNRDKPGFRPEGLTARERQDIQDAFCAAKRSLNFFDGASISDPAAPLDVPNETIRALQIPKILLLESFGRAFEHPLDTATKAIKVIVGHECPNKHVILCGGSAKNPGVQDAIKGICEKFELRPPIATAIQGTPRYNKHAQGGCLIERERLTKDVTPKKYFGELGNVLALQLGTSPRGGSSQAEWWDNCGILYPLDDQDDDDKTLTYIINGTLRHGVKRMAKIICGKVGDQLPEDSRGAKWGGSRPKYELGHTYDLLPEFELERGGNWGFKLTEMPLDENDQNAGELKFKFEVFHSYKGKEKWGHLTKAAYFTLHWSAGSGCMLLFDSETSVEESIVKMAEEHEHHEYSLWEHLPTRDSLPPKPKKPTRPRVSKAKSKVQKTTPTVSSAPVAPRLHTHQTRLATREGRVIATNAPAGPQPAAAAVGTQPTITSGGFQPSVTPAGTQLATTGAGPSTLPVATPAGAPPTTPHIGTQAAIAPMVSPAGTQIATSLASPSNLPIATPAGVTPTITPGGFQTGATSGGFKHGILSAGFQAPIAPMYPSTQLATTLAGPSTQAATAFVGTQPGITPSSTQPLITSTGTQVTTNPAGIQPTNATVGPQLGFAPASANTQPAITHAGPSTQPVVSRARAQPATAPAGLQPIVSPPVVNLARLNLASPSAQPAYPASTQPVVTPGSSQPAANSTTLAGPSVHPAYLASMQPVVTAAGSQPATTAVGAQAAFTPAYFTVQPASNAANGNATGPEAASVRQEANEEQAADEAETTVIVGASVDVDMADLEDPSVD